ncbi:MAG: hypothetical protein AB8H86_18870 [Polyangiales bacterium]
MSSPRREAAKTQWWRDLREEDKRELEALWDRRAERLDWSREDGAYNAVPVRLLGKVDDADTEGAADAEDAEYISTQLLEFILNHEDIVFFLEERTFHICRRHPLARTTLRHGRIPKGFRCEKAGEDCPLRRISRAAGRRIRFRLQVLRDAK